MSWSWSEQWSIGLGVFLRSGIRNQTGFQRHSLFFWRFEVFIASSWWCFPFPIHIMRIRKYHDVKIINDSILELFSFNLLGGLPYNWSVAQKKRYPKPYSRPNHSENFMLLRVTTKRLQYQTSTKPLPNHQITSLVNSFVYSVCFTKFWFIPSLSY